MSQRDYLGEFEQLVLLAILRLGANAYGMTIRREIEERSRQTDFYWGIVFDARAVGAEESISVRPWRGDSGTWGPREAIFYSQSIWQGNVGQVTDGRSKDG